MKAEKVYFKIEGSFITDFCRKRVLEGAWRHAVYILKECIIGSDSIIIDQILTCKKRFIGTNNLKLVNEDQSRDEVIEYKKTLKFQYGGMLYIPGSSIYWQPYAVISSFGPNDLGHDARDQRDFPVPATSRAWAGIKRSNRKGYDSVMYYAENQGDAAALLAVNREDKWVLWTKVQDPPLFVKSFSPADGAQKALNAWLKIGHHLQSRGHKEWFEPIKKPAAKKPKKKVKKPEKIASWHISDLEEIASCESGWLDRRGQFYRCAYMEHIGMAIAICEKLLGRSKDEDGYPYNHESYLETLGWCKLKNEAGPKYWRWWPGKKKLTQSQCGVILYWFAKRGKEIPPHLEGKLEDTE